MLVWTEPIVSSACGDYALLNAYIHILSTNVKHALHAGIVCSVFVMPNFLLKRKSQPDIIKLLSSQIPSLRAVTDSPSFMFHFQPKKFFL